MTNYYFDPSTGQYSYRESVAQSTTPTQNGSHDGTGAADHNEPFTYRAPSTLSTFPFTERQFARLLVLRGRHGDGEFTELGN